jgi:diguanylate cyclase (GGDEF)-like protein
MRLLQTSYDDNFERTIKQWIIDIKDNTALFHVYVPFDRGDALKSLGEVRRVLKNEAPDIPVLGCSATGEIFNGNMTDKEIVVTVMIFEDPGTRIEVVTYYEKEIDTEVVKVLEYAGKMSDLKGIEILTAAPYQRLEAAGKIIDELPEEIEIFGGVAVGDEKSAPYIFANDNECCSDGSVIVFYSGPDFHIQTYRMFGWKPIGYPIEVTKSSGAVIYELDGKPAYDVYNHYLQIAKDSDFFYNALEFPWEVKVGDTAYIRHAKSVNADGSIVMSTNVPQGSKIRISYGDPRSIMETTRQVGMMAIEFAPQVVNIINCMGRKLFWAGRENVEIAEISKYLEVTGFSALGEVMRFKGTTVLNNLSIVAAAMREGPKRGKIQLDLGEVYNSVGMPITARLAIFINTITEELMEKNRQLNEMLYKASHDAMTGLLNRGAIERSIYEKEDDSWHLIMFDVDDFKMVNDNFGHTEGDIILKAMADYLVENVGVLEGAEMGRWGGEEFMIVLSGYSDLKAYELAENICSQVKEKVCGHNPVTISVGVTMHLGDENVLETINRVDTLMYQAKNNGKDRVCSDLTSGEETYE